MDITPVSTNTNIINLEDYINSHQQVQQVEPQSGYIVDLSADKSETNSKLITYADPKNMTNEQLWDHYTQFTGTHIGKQLGDVKEYLQEVMGGAIDIIIDVDEIQRQLWERYGIDGESNPVHLQPGGKYSAEKLSEAFAQFAKNLSGGDSSKADLLLNAVKQGFEKAEEVWGGSLPEVSQQTYDLTVEKFKAWKNEDTSKVISDSINESTSTSTESISTVTSEVTAELAE